MPPRKGKTKTKKGKTTRKAVQKGPQPKGGNSSQNVSKTTSTAVPKLSGVQKDSPTPCPHCKNGIIKYGAPSGPACGKCRKTVPFFSFFGLPPELRVRVFDYIIADSPDSILYMMPTKASTPDTGNTSPLLPVELPLVRAKPKTSAYDLEHRYITASSLISVSRELNREFADELRANIFKVNDIGPQRSLLLRIFNWDFTYATTFLSGMAATEIDEIRDGNAKLIFLIVCTKACMNLKMPSSFVAFVKQRGQPRYKGMDIHYAVEKLHKNSVMLPEEISRWLCNDSRGRPPFHDDFTPEISDFWKALRAAS